MPPRRLHQVHHVKRARDDPPRRTLLLAALLLAAGCAGPAGQAASGGGDATATATIDYLAPTPPGIATFQVFVGQELGYFEEEGVEVNLVSAGEGISSIALLDNGKADVVGVSANEVFQGVAAGQDLRVVFDTLKHAVEGIVVPAGSDITSVADLRGRTVGLSADENRSQLNVALDLAGLTEQDVDTAVVGTSGPTLARLLDNQEIAAYVGSELDFAALNAAGVELSRITPSELADTPPVSFTLTPEGVEALGDDLPGFLRAWAKASEAALIDREMVEAILREAVPEEWENPEIAGALLDSAVELMGDAPGEDWGGLAAAPWQAAMEQAVDAGDLEEPVDLGPVLEERFLDAANDFDRAEVERDVREWAQQQRG